MDDVLLITIGERAERVTRSADGSVTVADRGVIIEPTVQAGELLASGTTTGLLYAVRSGETVWVFRDGETYVASAEPEGQAKRRKAHQHGSLMAPMPATVIAVNVKPGDSVSAGQILLVLEAMKMELPVRAPGDGVVAAVRCKAGELVQPNVGLIDLREPDSSGTGGDAQ